MMQADSATLLRAEAWDAETGAKRPPRVGGYSADSSDAESWSGHGSGSEGDSRGGSPTPRPIWALSAMGFFALAATIVVLALQGGEASSTGALRSIAASTRVDFGAPKQTLLSSGAGVPTAAGDDSEMQLAPPRSATLVTKDDHGEPTMFERSGENGKPAEEEAGPKLQAEGFSRYAEDCWKPCGGPGLCEDFCGAGRACCRWGSYGPNKDLTDPLDCAGSRTWPVLTYHVCVSAFVPPPQTPVTTQAPAEPRAPLPEAPTFKFYLFRAQNDEDKYEFGNVNVANLPGVMWYLNNEVMPRCPKRYGISRIRRYEITMKATPELYARGMNFGVRYSYDAGKCTGSNIRWLGPCSNTWDRFGYVLGCNNFRDHYPYPLVDTEYPNGIWYDLPMDGRCDHATGAWNCTWSYREAGEIRLEDVEAMEPGFGYCCDGKCTDFWRGHWSSVECDRRVAQVQEAFAKQYPEMPTDLPPPACDFDYYKFWD